MLCSGHSYRRLLLKHEINMCQVRPQVSAVCSSHLHPGVFPQEDSPQVSHLVASCTGQQEGV